MINVVITLHLYNAILVIASGVVAGIWGLILYFTKKTANRPWRISLIVTVALAVIQAVFGITMVITGHKPGGGVNSLYWLHYVYGGIAVAAIPFALMYATGGKNPRRDLLILSLAAIILALAAGRGLMTGLLPNT